MESTDEQVRLWSSRKERETYDNQADLYALIVCVEQLEKAYVRDAIPATVYTEECSKLIAQFKTALSLVGESVPDVKAFMAEYKLNCPAAAHRLLVTGVPATIEHAATRGSGSDNTPRQVAETTKDFITLSDALKMDLRAADSLHPLLSDLMQSLTSTSALTSDFPGKEKLLTWLIELNQMKARDELDEEQMRQLAFDVENAFSEFYRSLSSGQH
ncbi:vacuolar protein sorting-associated [Syncephalis plumigaleata]|nr:vacuolar protein sorting-associated [Syncephalis plumigaleata]